MKNFIVILLIGFLCVACESIVGPEDPPIDLIEPADTLSAEIEILSWSQIYNEPLNRYENVEITYAIKNTGNIKIDNYELYWFFEEEDSTNSELWIKNTYHFESIDVNQAKTDELNTGNIRHDMPVVNVECYINALNF